MKQKPVEGSSRLYFDLKIFPELQKKQIIIDSL